MIYPKFLEKNNCIGVPAPSAGANNDEKKNKFENAEKNLKSFGYRLEISKNIYKNDTGRSAPAKERAKEINYMIKNNDIDMIMCATGGDFLIEILPYIDFNLIKNNPKFIAGFSDPTGLLYPITTKYDIATIYGKNFSSFGINIEEYINTHKEFLEIIKGNLIEQNNYELYEETYLDGGNGLEGYNLTEKVYWKTLDEKPVQLRGRIIGGCFDIISELAGTKFDGIQSFNEKYKNDGIIWYFDNCEFSMEETIRTLWKMEQLEYFKYAKGVIFGRFGVKTTAYNYDTKSCLKDSALSKLQIPIIYDADISHKSPCMTIINGAIANINVKEGKSNISFELK